MTTFKGLATSCEKSFAELENNFIRDISKIGIFYPKSKLRRMLNALYIARDKNLAEEEKSDKI